MIEFTGERVIPGHVDPDLWEEHISRYAFAARWTAGARVLDLGCGAGYGTAELAGRARSAVGIDLAPEATDYARSAYRFSNLLFVPASVTAVPFRDGSFDLVIAFEVIEHLNDWQSLLSEARRLLAPGGVFLVSTPNKEYYNVSRGSSGPNPFHTHEFEFDEFKNELARYFPCCTVLLQNHVEAFAFYHQDDGASNGDHCEGATVATGIGASMEGRMETVRGSPQEAHFFLAVCSQDSLPPRPGFVFIQHGSNVLREREQHIEILQNEVSDAREQFTALHRAHDQLTLHMEAQNRWVLGTVEELEAARRDLASVLQKLTVAEATVVERTLWAQSLDAHGQVLAAEVQSLTGEKERLSAEVQRLMDQVEDLKARFNLWRASRWTKLGRKLNLGPDLDQAPGRGEAASG